MIAPQLGVGLDGRRTRVKVCGCRSKDEVTAAIEAGADAVGLIFAPSPRNISPQQGAVAVAVAPVEISVVGVFVDPTPAELECAWKLMPQMIPQFSGSESPALCRHLGVAYLKVFQVSVGEPNQEQALKLELERYPEALAMFETASAQRGGSGRTFDWGKVQQLMEGRPAVISGGLDASNVGDCVRLLRPYAVDVRSGVESQGRKDTAKLRAFMQAVRSADATT